MCGCHTDALVLKIVNTFPHSSFRFFFDDFFVLTVFILAVTKDVECIPIFFSLHAHIALPHSLYLWMFSSSHM
jgi:hypothetical protein